MLLLDDVLLLLRHSKRFTYAELLLKLLPHLHPLQYQQEQIIRNTCNHLKKQLTTFARRNSPVYKNRKTVIGKEDLGDQANWYVQTYRGAAAHTGGSTTGQRFHYLRWADAYNGLEGGAHYRAILTEFKIEKPAHILYLMLDQTDARYHDSLVKTYRTNNILISHGQQQRATIHEIIKNRTYYMDYYRFYEDIISYTSNNDIDIILAPGHVIAALAWNVRRLGHTARLAGLLSNTGQKVRRHDLDTLRPTIDNWCDHMRCWDGGVTFFTCRFNTYHLLDGVAWAESDRHHRLLSYDFYSLASPFVNYWNGDYATIGTTYQRCRCGRLYREFEINRTRSVELNGVTNVRVRTQLAATGLTAAIKRAEATNNFLRVFTHRPLSSQERHDLRHVLPQFEINFVAED
jgi:hypothetical protein